MLSGALETYAAALIVIGASTTIGGGILAACGWRRWSWTAPAVGLAAATLLAWWAVRLPGHGLTALIVLAVASVLGAALAIHLLDGLTADLRRGAPAAALALLAVAIPFVAEGHFGVLGTGFNVDMSQHLFAAGWLADPTSALPGTYAQGYPLGPHALAAATGEISGNLATSFSGITIAAPVIVALTALASVPDWPRRRATLVAGLTAFAYLASSYLAQGSFKELFEMAFLLGFVLWLADLPRAVVAAPRGWSAAIPGAVLCAGTLYAYSAPGLAWPLGALGVWAVVALVVHRERGRELVRAALPHAAAGAIVLVLLAAPELDRIIDFGGSVGTVSDATATAGSEGGGSGSKGGGGAKTSREPKFDNSLGNLFGQISPLEAFGIWPSGDFRVAPGDGAIPAAVFYLGALLGAVALAIGVAAAARRGETALLAALAAAAAIWLGARIASTPYTTAKALEMLAPVVMLVAAKGLLEPLRPGTGPGRNGLIRAALALAFVAGAGLSGALALANAPVGPRDYSAGVGELSDQFAGQPVLLLASASVLADEHGQEFYGWELRDASATCVAASDEADGSERAPNAFHFVITTEGASAAPYLGLVRVDEAAGVTLWRRANGSASSTLLLPDASGDVDCAKALG